MKNKTLIRIHSFSLCIAFVLLMVSCKKANEPAPVPEFSYTGNTLAPAVISFTNKTTNANSYLWDFGDNKTSTEIHPSHTYIKGGVYTVILKASGNEGTTTISKTVNISNPTSVKITQVKVIQMPFVDGNAVSWDNGSGPDVFFTISDANDAVLYSHPSHFSDVTSANLPLTFNLTTPFQSTNFPATYKIRLFDYDTLDPDDFISGYAFQFGDWANTGYPTTATLYLNGSSTKIELSLQWQ